MPGSAFEVVEAKFFLKLLVGLLADPSRLDRGGERLEAGVGRQVGKIVFALAPRRAARRRAGPPRPACADVQ